MFKKTMAAFLAVVVLGLGTAASFAVGAGASSSDNGSTATVVNQSLVAVVVGAHASAADVSSGRITILADMHVKPSVSVNSPSCYWTKGGFYNSGVGTNGARSYWDPKPGKLCPSKSSPTGYVKVAGGTSGRNCGNVASGKRPAYPVVKGKVIMVRSLAVVHIQLTAHARVSVSCETAVAKASASADGSSYVSITLRQYLVAKGPVASNLMASAVYKATANASATAQCVVLPPPPPPATPPPPPPVTTTVTTTTTETKPPPPPHQGHCDQKPTPKDCGPPPPPLP